MAEWVATTRRLDHDVDLLAVGTGPGGVLFSSNPRGNNEAGWNGGRYGAYYDLPTWQRHVTGAGFVELTHYYRPDGLPREQQRWLATVWRKPAAGAARKA